MSIPESCPTFTLTSFLEPTSLRDLYQTTFAKLYLHYKLILPAHDPQPLVKILSKEEQGLHATIPIQISISGRGVS